MPRKPFSFTTLDPLASRCSVSTPAIAPIRIITENIQPATPSTDDTDSPVPSSASSDAPSWTTCDEHTGYFSSATSLASSVPSDLTQKQEEQKEEEQQQQQQQQKQEQQPVPTALPPAAAAGILRLKVQQDPLSRDYPKPEQEPTVEGMLSRPPQKWSLAHHIKHARDARVPVVSPDKRAKAFAEEKERLRQASREMAARQP